MLELILAVINTGFIPNVYGYLLLAIVGIFLYQLLRRRRILVNSVGEYPLWVLLVTGLMYAFASRSLGISLINGLVSYCMLPVLIFMTGHSITNNSGRGAVRMAERCLCAIAIGCSIHVALNITVNFGIKRAQTADFFTGNLAATNLGSLNTYIFALLPCLLVTRRKKLRIAGLILFGLSVVYAFILGTRTQPYALIVMLVFSAIIYVRRHYSKGIQYKTLGKWLLVAILLAAITYIAYRMDVGGIRTQILKSNLIYRYSRNAGTAASDASRIRYFFTGLRSLFENPLGGVRIRDIDYFHNYWLDVGGVAGTLPVILIASMDIMFIVHMFRVFRNTAIDEDFRYALLGLYICFFVNFFMEPIMEGYLDLFYRFTLINGLVEGLHALTCRGKKRGVLLNNRRSYSSEGL